MANRCNSCKGVGEYQTVRGWRRCPDCGGSGDNVGTCEECHATPATGDGPYPTLCHRCGKIQYRMDKED